MARTNLTRRHLILAAAAMAAPSPLRAERGPAIHVLKDPDCGCCAAWMDILAQAGFRVTSQPVAGAALTRAKRDLGIPEPLMSCHTGLIDGYAIEGHVPPADILRLIADAPDAVGLAVPGMPYGSPGMGPEEERQAYDVHLLLPGGGSRIFRHYGAA